MNIRELKALPEWKDFKQAKRERTGILQGRIRALDAKLVDLQAEAPKNTNCGWFSGGNNESFELNHEFRMAKESMVRAEQELYQLASAPDSVRQSFSQACYSSIVVLVDEEDRRRVFRLVLTSEPENDSNLIEHVEMGSPLGVQLQGKEEDEEFMMGFGGYRKKMRVEVIL